MTFPPKETTHLSRDVKYTDEKALARLETHPVIERNASRSAIEQLAVSRTLVLFIEARTAPHGRQPRRRVVTVALCQPATAGCFAPRAASPAKFQLPSPKPFPVCP